jgi:hypothetical protein
MTNPTPNYYYEPPSSGGKYETYLSNVGSYLGPALVMGAALLLTHRKGADPMRIANAGAGGAGAAVKNYLGDLGHVIDNMPSILRNLKTGSNEVSDYRSWISPGLDQ